MKKYLPYAIAALVGFHLRWVVSALNGWSYSMNGADIFVALMCVVMVWSFKGAFLPKKSTERRTSNVHPKRAHARHNAVSERTEP